jgi:hypothetical protein
MQLLLVFDALYIMHGEIVYVHIVVIHISIITKNIA